MSNGPKRRKNKVISGFSKSNKKIKTFISPMGLFSELLTGHTVTLCLQHRFEDFPFREEERHDEHVPVQDSPGEAGGQTQR